MDTKTFSCKFEAPIKYYLYRSIDVISQIIEEMGIKNDKSFAFDQFDLYDYNFVQIINLKNSFCAFSQSILYI